MKMLEVAIGLSFIYLVLSLTVTAANEMLASWLKRRALLLRKGMISLIEDEDVVRRLYEHPLIRGLYHTRLPAKGEEPDTVKRPFLRALFGGSPGPSYIPSRAFATAFLDVVADLYPPESTARTTSSSPALKALRVLERDSDGRQDLIKNVEVWFNDSMERVSGWYKRRTQLLSLFIAALVVVGTNADSLVIARALWTNPELRQATVARAGRYAAEQPRPVSDSTQPVDATLPPPLPPDQQADADFQEASETLRATMADLEELELPIGWDAPEDEEGDDLLTSLRLVRDDATDDWPGPIWSEGGASRWLQALDNHMLGWLLSIMAV